MTITVTPSVGKPDLDALRAACKRHGITHDRIAAEAHVSRPMVVNVFAGRSTSRNVVETIVRLLAKAERRAKRKSA